MHLWDSGYPCSVGLKENKELITYEKLQQFNEILDSVNHIKWVLLWEICQAFLMYNQNIESWLDYS